MTFPSGPARTLVLIDGEHYPPVVRAAVEQLRADGYEVVGAALLGGTEKLAPGEVPDVGVPETVTGPRPLDALLAALDRFSPEVVYDLSDEPVVDARTRTLLAAHALRRGARYEGADFRFDPPPRPRLATKPSVAVIGTGKRTGKTALAAHLARLLAQRGTPPVVVAMGRGGPDEPELIDPGTFDLSPEGLVALADSGRHAASDHLEDALMARVVTVGTRRAGGGLAGASAYTTFERGIHVANARHEPVLILEGSGSAIPPVHADATVLVVPATADPELVTGYLGAYRVLLADLVVVTLVGEPLVGAVAALEDRVRELVPGLPVVPTHFRPWPLEPISGRSVFLATTAPVGAAQSIAASLETEHGARVVGVSANLANRTLLNEDLPAAGGAEVLVTELKAAGVDVATRFALETGMEVVYCDNRPAAVGGVDLDERLGEVVATAEQRFEVCTAQTDEDRPAARRLAHERDRAATPGSPLS